MPKPSIALAWGMGATLEEEIRQRIRSGGPIPFAEFMRLALYHPAHGYYARRVPGPTSDFSTSPSISPWFGRLLARHLEHMWVALGRPNPFTVVEVGAGGADLASAGLAAAAPPLASALRWRIVEPFEEIRRRQRQRLEAAPAEWAHSLTGEPPVTGCILANEVLDNLPVHLLEIAGGQAQEIHIGVQGERFVERPGPLSEHALRAPAHRAVAHLQDGDRFEVCLELDTWCAQASAALERGYLLVIDYGDVEPSLWLRRPAGSLVTYRDGRMGIDALRDPGLADITSHVNFSALERAAGRAGLRPQPLMAQGDWLRRLGLTEIIDSLRQDQREAQLRKRHDQALAALAERSRAAALGVSGGLGDFLVFLAEKEASIP
ncbi:MAG: class I SAM-dependent methyltransferase [Actinomycetota bacterium]